MPCDRAGLQRLSQEKLGEALGVSRRTVIRWATRSVPSESQLTKLAGLVHPFDEGLASELAVAAGKRLPELGLAPATPPEPSRPEDALPLAELTVDSIVHAAASAASASPQAARAAVLAALERAATLGMTADALREALRARG